MRYRVADTICFLRSSYILYREKRVQVYVAERVGCTPQKLNDMIAGRCLIKACDIPRIAKALGVEINYLFEIEKGA